MLNSARLQIRTLFEKNSVHAAFYRKYLKAEFQIERYEWESCGNTGTGKFPEGKNSMHLPFYQTNTSQYCPLYAACTKGSRSAQMPVRECPRFCEKQAFLYPEHLRMMGRYNSLFGMNLTVLQDPETIGKMYAFTLDMGLKGLPIGLACGGLSSLILNTLRFGYLAHRDKKEGLH